MKIILTGFGAFVKEIGDNLDEKRDVSLSSFFGVTAPKSDNLDDDVEQRLQNVLGELSAIPVSEYAYDDIRNQPDTVHPSGPAIDSSGSKRIRE